jgi:murein L,D-transpeptidase YafK
MKNRRLKIICGLFIAAFWVSDISASESSGADKDSNNQANAQISADMNSAAQNRAQDVAMLENEGGNVVKTRYEFGQNIKPPTDVRADRILVEKKKRKLTLFYNGKVLREYQISLGREPIGHKTRRGDNKTPEGLYYIDYRVEESDFHRALHISYPNIDDKLRAREQGVPPGGNIMLHGLKNGDKEIAYYHGVFDWTNGCIAVTNTEIEEIWHLVPNRTPIYILP